MTIKKSSANKNKATAILEAVYEYQKGNSGEHPSYREIMDMTGIKSTSNMSHYIPRLAANGLITKSGKGASRGVGITPAGMEAIGKPVVCLCCMRPYGAAQGVRKMKKKPFKNARFQSALA